MARGGRLAHPGIGGEDAQARIGDQLAEGTLEFFEARALVEEGLALGLFGRRMAVRPKRWRYMGHSFFFWVFLGVGGWPTGRTRW
jgi:hypothetical protein